MRLRYAFGLLLICLSVQSAAQAPTDSIPSLETAPKRQKISFVPIPIIFSQPETGLGYGVAVLPVWRFGTDTLVRKSNARLLAWRTQQRQSLIQLTHSMFTTNEQYIVSGELSYYYRFPINYYGTGPRTSRSDESVIEYKVFIGQQRVLRRLRPDLFVGLQGRITDLRDLQVKRDIERDGMVVAPSRFQERPVRERQDTRVIGVGPVLLYDHRDNVLSAYRGSYLELSALFNGGALGSDFQFGRYLLDARRYISLDQDHKTVLAGQVVGQFQAGAVPFRELANLGGDKLLRGYYDGRYRDRQLVVAQVELRRQLFWRFNGVLFGGVGQVGNTLADFDEGGLKYTGGAGLRFKFNRRDRLNVRFDYGVGRDGSTGFYFNFGEAF
ncbi:outer membrane protein assembly factor [Hymenobacter tibetensis]|uniref:Outer membrane protein assembly factor n=1 Tax=Hymenobacter tibetensis TaxID=497967 RepID=A0ABY4CZJ2_9BACT|nr:BamA/TamA family outer membrane protein [Hymenobacter tibetensis]UOG75568.1 outer membrane protein assembly factor [Hymenobacter tibetensis]